jgi:hypothetical protein
MVILKNKFLVNWPDGLFSKVLKKGIKKIPGREIILKIKLSKDISEIIVLGNLEAAGKNLLNNRFKIPFKNIPLPFGTADQIIKNLSLRIKKKTISSDYFTNTKTRNYCWKYRYKRSCQSTF